MAGIVFADSSGEKMANENVHAYNRIKYDACHLIHYVQCMCDGAHCIKFMSIDDTQITSPSSQRSLYTAYFCMRRFIKLILVFFMRLIFMNKSSCTIYYVQSDSI